MDDRDRTYTYIAKTFDAPESGSAGFNEAMMQLGLPVWRHLYDAGLITSVQLMHKVGDVDLETSSVPVRDWSSFALLELAPGAAVESVLQAEQEAGLTVDEVARHDVQYLSNEVTVRPAAAGTAIPVPSPKWTSPPPNHCAAIEYIHIPADHWDEYRQFMKEVMGPVGTRLVELGHSFQIQIMECARVLHRSPSLPEWNRIHILWGDFDDPDGGFIDQTSVAVRDVLGTGYDARAALGPVSRYRNKPRMSKNRLVEELCIGELYNGGSTKSGQR